MIIGNMVMPHLRDNPLHSSINRLRRVTDLPMRGHKVNMRLMVKPQVSPPSSSVLQRSRRRSDGLDVDA